MMIAKAFIAASKDPIKGNYQTAAAIADTVYTNYVALCVEQTKLDHLDMSKLIRNEGRGTKAAPKPTTDALERPPNNTYKVRSSTAVWTQFKTKIAKECMHYGGIVTIDMSTSDTNEQGTGSVSHPTHSFDDKQTNRRTRR
jgi:hypothetical protein